jgi:mannose-1-phosphate guanylyltransferase
MKAMILAAGEGSRVRPITYLMPKPMIPIINKPIIEYIIEHLRDNGIDELVINTSYLATDIENYLRDGSRFGCRIAYSFEGRLVDNKLEGQAIGSAAGIRRIQDFSGFFDDTFLVICGDALIDLDIGAVVGFHRRKGSIATIVLKDVPHDEVHKYGVVRMDADGRVLAFQEKPRPEDAVSNTANTGIYIFEPRIFDFIPPGKKFDIGSDLLPSLVGSGEKVYGLPQPFEWIDIGSVPDYWDASMKLISGHVHGYAIPGNELRKGIHCGINLRVNFENVTLVPPVFIGSSTEIADGASITGPAIIGNGCVIESGAYINQCIIGDYTRVSPIAHISQKIVIGNKYIDASGNYLDLVDLDVGWVIDDARRVPEESAMQQMILDLINEKRVN